MSISPQKLALEVYFISFHIFICVNLVKVGGVDPMIYDYPIGRWCKAHYPLWYLLLWSHTYRLFVFFNLTVVCGVGVVILRFHSFHTVWGGVKSNCPEQIWLIFTLLVCESGKGLGYETLYFFASRYLVGVAWSDFANLFTFNDHTSIF